jgi:hypothetical protein
MSRTIRDADTRRTGWRIDRRSTRRRGRSREGRSPGAGRCWLNRGSSGARRDHGGSGVRQPRIVEPGNQDVIDDAGFRGGWKIARGRSTGRSPGSCGKAWTEPSPTTVRAKVSMAHCPSAWSVTEGTAGTGAAGFPEHMGPEQGGGDARSREAAGSPDSPSNSRWVISPPNIEREVT